MVSVCVQTYQQVNYIKACLDGILIQKTKFPFEIILGEDESNDGTREICVEYAEKYPDKIRLFLRSRKDVIYIGGQPTGRYNMIENIKASKGKFIALCEGDDYWTDPYKLQKQVDFLEAHTDYGLVHTDYDAFYQQKGILKKKVNRNREIPTGNVFNELLINNFITTCTVCVRRDLLLKSLESLSFNWMMGDYPLWLIISLNHKIGYLKESAAVYRIQANSASHHDDSTERRFKFVNSTYEIKYHFIEKYDCDSSTLATVNNNYKKYILNSALLLKQPQLIDKYLKARFIPISYLDKLIYYIGASNSFTVFFAKSLRKILRKMKIYEF